MFPYPPSPYPKENTYNPWLIFGFGIFLHISEQYAIVSIPLSFLPTALATINGLSVLEDSYFTPLSFTLTYFLLISLTSQYSYFILLVKSIEKFMLLLLLFFAHKGTMYMCFFSLLCITFCIPQSYLLLNFLIYNCTYDHLFFKAFTTFLNFLIF